MNFNDPGLVHHRAAVVVLHRHRRQRAQAVQLRYCGGGPLYPGHGVAQGLAQPGEQLIFQRRIPVGGRENIVLQILQLLCDVALAVDQRLLADVCPRHQLLEGVGDLDVVAEYLVVADLQGADAGLFLLGSLHGGDDALAAVEDAPQPVHFRVKAVPDELTLPHGEGGIVLQSLADDLCQILQRIQPCAQLPQMSALEGGQLLANGGQMIHGVFQGHHVPASGAAVDDAAHEPLHVPDAGESQDQLLPLHGVLHQRRHGVVAPCDGGNGQQGPLQPASQQPCAHGGPGLVQYPQKAALFLLAPQSFRQLQIPPGRQIQLHELPLPVVVQPIHVLQIRFLGVMEVIQQRPQRQHGRRVVTGQPLGGVVPELLADALFGGGQLEPPGGQTLHVAPELVLQQRPQGRILGGAGIQHRLRRGEAPQLILQVGLPIRPGEGRHMGLPRGDIAHAEPGVVSVQIDAGAEVAAPLLQTGGVDDGTRRHDADDVPLHQPLGGGRILRLLADGHLVALGNEPGDIGVGGVVRDAAHGDLLLEGLVLVLIPCGKGQIQLTGRLPGVVPEHLVKIPQPKEQDGVLVLLLDFHILAHHGRHFCHTLIPLSARNK